MGDSVFFYWPVSGLTYPRFFKGSQSFYFLQKMGNVFEDKILSSILLFYKWWKLTYRVFFKITCFFQHFFPFHCLHTGAATGYGFQTADLFIFDEVRLSSCQIKKPIFKNSTTHFRILGFSRNFPKQVSTYFTEETVHNFFKKSQRLRKVSSGQAAFLWWGIILDQTEISFSFFTVFQIPFLFQFSINLFFCKSRTLSFLL